MHIAWLGVGSVHVIESFRKAVCLPRGSRVSRSGCQALPECTGTFPAGEAPGEDSLLHKGEPTHSACEVKPGT